MLFNDFTSMVDTEQNEQNSEKEGKKKVVDWRTVFFVEGVVKIQNKVTMETKPNFFNYPN
jgi:hypothetical protein